VVVFADPPTVKKTNSKEWQIRIPLADPKRGETMRLGQLSDTEDREFEVRQLTGCTSPRTLVVFTQAEIGNKQKPGTHWTDVYVIDSWGTVLARADLPKLPR
jgi:hypothetical protein